METPQSIYSLGWNDDLSKQWVPFQTLSYLPLRIVWEGKGLFRASDGTTNYDLSLSGSYRNLVDLGLQQKPVVGDWVAARLEGPDHYYLEAVLLRKNAFHKPIVERGEAVAANIDYGAIVMDAYHDLNLRRIERFMSVLHADNIAPLLILTKIDLVEEPEDYRNRVQARFPDLPVFLIDAVTGSGVNSLLSYLKPVETLMLLGLSGAGKSTLLNCLSEASVAKTGEVRSKDGRGRHTTTSRQLHILPNGTILIDTPGIRAVGMSSGAESITDAFPDIQALAQTCKYSNCTHTGEPGCAVQAALLAEELEHDRYLNFLGLREEARSSEEIAIRRKEMDKALGKLLYRYRRGEHEYH